MQPRSRSLQPLAAGLLALLGASACSRPSPTPAVSLFTFLESARVEAVAHERASDSPAAPRIVGWPAIDVPEPCPGSREAASRAGSLLLGDEARSVVWLRPGERLALPVPRTSTELGVELHLAVVGADGAPAPAGSVELDFDLEQSDGTRNRLDRWTWGARAVEDSRAAGTWQRTEVRFPKSLRQGVLWLGITGIADDPSLTIAVGTLRTRPADERPVGRDLRLTLAAEDAELLPADAGALTLAGCWSPSPLPELAVGSILSGHHPSTVAEARHPTLAGRDLPASLGSALRDAGYATTAVVETGGIGARFPLDLGWERVLVVAPGEGVARSTALLAEASSTARAVLVITTGNGPAAVDLKDDRIELVAALPSVRPAEFPTLDPERITTELAILSPGLDPGRSEAAHELTDILPTVCTLLALTEPERMHGRSAIRRIGPGLFEEVAPEPERSLWSEVPDSLYLWAAGVRHSLWLPDSMEVERAWDRIPEGDVELAADPRRLDAARARMRALRLMGEVLYAPEVR
ncbi:MAG: alkaline phosphatase family protein [Planctomycetota bacterium]